VNTRALRLLVLLSIAYWLLLGRGMVQAAFANEEIERVSLNLGMMTLSIGYPKHATVGETVSLNFSLTPRIKIVGAKAFGLKEAYILVESIAFRIIQDDTEVGGAELFEGVKLDLTGATRPEIPRAVVNFTTIKEGVVVLVITVRYKYYLAYTNGLTSSKEYERNASLPLTVVYPPKLPEEVEQLIADLKSELESVKSEYLKLMSEYNALKSRYEELETAYRELSWRYDALRREYERLREAGTISWLLRQGIWGTYKLILLALAILVAVSGAITIYYGLKHSGRGFRLKLRR